MKVRLCGWISDLRGFRALPCHWEFLLELLSREWMRVMIWSRSPQLQRLTISFWCCADFPSMLCRTTCVFRMYCCVVIRQRRPVVPKWSSDPWNRCSFHQVYASLTQGFEGQQDILWHLRSMSNYLSFEIVLTFSIFWCEIKYSSRHNIYIHAFRWCI